MMATGNGTLAEKPQQQWSLRDYLGSDAMIKEFRKSLPKHCSPERMARVALTALTRTPALANCTTESVIKCMLDCSQWGLEPDGRRAHLIPYGKTCTLILDYKGLVELAYRSGVVKSIHADVVRDGDIFAFSAGHVKEHVPHFLRRDAGKPKDAGNVFAVYCIVELAGGATKHDVMSLEQVEAVRNRSRAGKSGPWVSDWDEMAKKTVFRRASKWLPLSAEIIDAFDRDDDKLTEVTVTENRQTAADITALIAAGQQSLSESDQFDLANQDAEP